MSPTEKLTTALAANEPHLHQYNVSALAISQRVGGWSKQYHYYFFKSFLDAFPEARSVLIVGVYLGRDISFILDAAGERHLTVTGIDKFNAEPCDDWPEEKRSMTWEQAFNCPPPDIEVAYGNIGANGNHAVHLVKANDKDWLESANGAFDLIYLDTAHDKATVQRQIRQVHKLCHPFTIIAGDDYENIMPTWGVKEAVAESFRSHQVLADTIWFAGAEGYL